LRRTRGALDAHEPSEKQDPGLSAELRPRSFI
jgi:hypothetical protein